MEAKWRRAAESPRSKEGAEVRFEGFQWTVRNPLRYRNDTSSYPWIGPENRVISSSWEVPITPASANPSIEDAPELVLRLRLTQRRPKSTPLDLEFEAFLVRV